MNNEETFIKELEKSCLNNNYYKTNYRDAIDEQILQFQTGKSLILVAEELRRIVTAALFKLGQSVFTTVRNYNVKILPESDEIFYSKIAHIVSYLKANYNEEQHWLQTIFNECQAFLNNRQKTSTEDFAGKFVNMGTRRMEGTAPSPQNVKKNETFAELYGSKSTTIKGYTCEVTFVGCHLTITDVVEIFCNDTDDRLKFISADGTETVINGDYLCYQIKP